MTVHALVLFEGLVMQTCDDEIVDLIREHYSFLFDQSQFNLTHSESLRYGEYCFVVLTSSFCKIRFTSEWGVINMFFGQSSAPDRWDDEGWYYLGNILDYVEDLTPSLDARRMEDKKLRKLSVGKRQKYWAKRLKPVSKQVIAIFEKENSREIRQLDAYVRNYKKEIGRQLRERSN